ncbi:hypothetical protein Msi02_32520 [Microbispora siamensis]|uniref:Uncharacterized protein n=1 Tax=Microbispora siamensis TaxID=564413 RepID=A0ABQ4GLY7_9ACTN|nr:hypothetical protein Msi02_32520 [Microbispora siamensis]
MVSFVFAESSAVDAAGTSPLSGVVTVAGGSGGMTVEAAGGAATAPDAAAAGSALKAPAEAVSAALLIVTQAMRSRVVELVDRGSLPRVFRLCLPG